VLGKNQRKNKTNITVVCNGGDGLQNAYRILGKLAVQKYLEKKDQETTRKQIPSTV